MCMHKAQIWAFHKNLPKMPMFVFYSCTYKYMINIYIMYIKRSALTHTLQPCSCFFTITIYNVH